MNENVKIGLEQLAVKKLKVTLYDEGDSSEDEVIGQADLDPAMFDDSVRPESFPVSLDGKTTAYIYLQGSVIYKA
jgi:hypothetical protein